MALTSRADKMQVGADEQAASRSSRRSLLHGILLSACSTADQDGPQLPLDFPVRNLGDR